MESEGIFSTGNYLGKYESLIRSEVGKELDDLKSSIKELEYICLTRKMNIDSILQSIKPVTIQKLLETNHNNRQKILASLIYNDSYLRIEASYIMICAGRLNVAYTNLRTALDDMITAFLVERYDEEAKKFLSNGDDIKVDLLKIEKEKLLPKEHNESIKNLKKQYNVLGVHSRVQAIRLSNLFGINQFDKLRAGLNNAPDGILKLPEGFKDEAAECINNCNRVIIYFLWLETMPIKM